MRVLFGGDVHVDYAQVYVVSGEEHPGADLFSHFGGQVNGLCGAAVPGYLVLFTGLHMGRVGFAVELHEGRPPVDDAWEEVVEAPFRPGDEPVQLLEWDGYAFPLDLDPRDYRVRYCGLGMDEGRAADTRVAPEPEIDRYLLQFWPAPPAPDEVVRQTSAEAAYRHEFARQQPPPPPPPPPLTEEEKAELERAAEERQRAWFRQMDIDSHWGGVAPPEPLLALGGNAAALAALDRPLVEAVAAAEPEVQRRIARWSARRACDAAGVSSLDWVAPALDALDRGEALPAPWDEPDRVWRLLHGGAEVRAVAVFGGIAPTPPTLPPIWPPGAAVAAVLDTAAADPLAAAVNALGHAAITVGDDWPTLFADLRRAFLVPPG